LAQSGRNIFKIGQFDGSSQEFSGGYPKGQVEIDAEDPSAAKSWYSYQPVPGTGQSETPEDASTPRIITFKIAGQPVGAYTLRIGILIERASVPALRAEINGHQGTFYLDPKLDNRVDGGSAVSFPAFSQAIVSFQVPGNFLHAGENTIALSAVAQGDGDQIPDAGFNYDALAMSQGSSVDQSEVRIKPTVFYKQEHGFLEEGVDVTLRHENRPVRSVCLTINGSRVTLPGNGLRWGEQRTRFYIPAFGPRTPAHIEVDRGMKIDTEEQVINPAKRWTVYVVPHVHLDLGYTDYQAKVASVQSRVIDEALDLIHLHPEFRFSVDGMWSVEQFMNSRTLEDRERAVAAMKTQQFFAPAEYANELTGFASAETLIRSLYAGAQFSRINGTPLNYANITDVPSYSWSYASILASAGIHELLAGANNGRAPVLLRGHLDETSPFYWQGPDGKKVLMWYSRHYHQMWMIFGLPPLVNAGEQTLPLFLQMYGRPTYKASSTMLYGSQVENTDLFPGQAELVEQWNQKYAYPHLEYAGFHHALTSIAAEFKGNIPTVSGDGGPYWEDGIAADAYYAGMERETEARGPSAEKLATISSLANSRIAVDKKRLDAMWRNMVLMDEHTWTSAASYSDNENDEAVVQLAVKDSRAIHAHELCDWLMRHAMADIADSIDTPANSLVVFNTLNWKRSSVVSFDLRKGYGVFDSATGKPMPIEASSRGEYTNRVSFWADDIPAVGYKTYLLRPEPKEPLTEESGLEKILENQFYRLELDPSTGAVRGIFDKQLGKQIVNESSPYRFGEYLYVTTDDARRGPDRFVVHGATLGKLVSIEEEPEGITARIVSTDLDTPRIVATITLSSHEKQILFTENVDKTATKNDEAVYFAFPFAMNQPQFQYEIQNGVVDPSRDMYPGAGLDWFSVQHWAAVQQGGIAAAVMPLDASLMTFGDITRLGFPETFGARKGTIFSYAMNNYWHTNYRAEQGGHFRFRYVVTSAAAVDPVKLSRQGWEAITPLEVSEVTPSDKAVETRRPLAGGSGSFLSVDDPSLMLETWKPAEDEQGTILRFLDLGGVKRTVRIKFPLLTLKHAWMTDALERDQKELTIAAPHTLDLEITPHAIVTIRILNRVAQVPPAAASVQPAHAEKQLHPLRVKRYIQSPPAHCG
jgi:hypothetical protein